jgi:hypothetical protein
MSQSGSDTGNFVVSIKDQNGCHHFEIEVSFQRNISWQVKVILALYEMAKISNSDLSQNRKSNYKSVK